jgi:hypothetical protein
MKTTTIRRAAAIALFPLALAGCRSGYDVNVRNLTDQPVTANLNVPFGDGAPRTLSSRYIGPGDRQNLFVQTDYKVPVTLAVDFAGNVGYPATLDLTRGQTVVNVRRSEPGPQGRLQLEAIPRP